MDVQNQISKLKKIIVSFYEKDLLLSKLKLCNYPEPDSNIVDKVKLLLDWSNYAIKKLEYAVVDTSNLPAEREFIALKAEVGRVGINKLVNVSTGLNDLKTKVDDLDLGKLKTVHINLKKLNDAVSK